MLLPLYSYSFPQQKLNECFIQVPILMDEYTPLGDTCLLNLKYKYYNVESYSKYIFHITVAPFASLSSSGAKTIEEELEL